jgi:hypothetical protein
MDSRRISSSSVRLRVVTSIGLLQESGELSCPHSMKIYCPLAELSIFPSPPCAFHSAQIPLEFQVLLASSAFRTISGVVGNSVIQTPIAS